MSNVKISQLPAASSVTGTEQFEVNASGSSKRVTASQIKSYLTSADLDMGGNKVLFGNVYSALSDLPNAGTYHGMFAHVHATGKAYFGHNSAWVELQNAGGDVTLGNWTIKEVSGALHFLVSGTAKMKLDASGNLTVVGDVSAFGSI